jgi:hypothetical protein
MAHSLTAVLFLAFGLGLVHAFDADHIMAVSGLGAKRRPITAWRFCVRWALGHGITLFAIGGLALLIGLHLPVAFSAFAEAAVALVLIGIGIGVLRDLRRQSHTLRFHDHPGLPAHAHWHDTGRRHDHRAVLVGMLHGAAGSAPLLAVLPVTQQGGAGFGLLYLLMFSAAVLVAMLVFGGLLGTVFRRARRAGEVLFNRLRALIALGAMAAGGHLLYGLA